MGAVTDGAMSFVPLQTRTGTFAGEYLRALPDRDVVIWGAGVLGRCLMRQLRAFALPGQRFFFTDSNPALYETRIDDQPVLDLELAMRQAHAGHALLVTAVAGHLKEHAARLVAAGLRADEDFVSYLGLSRPEAVIQVSTRHGDTVDAMPLDTCQAVLAKLKADIPDLFHVDLSGWGEPLDNPCLADIIRATGAIAPCTVTTRLLADKPAIEQALRAAPMQFVVTVDGFDTSYHTNTPDGNWEIFVERLRFVSEMQRQMVGKTEIRLRYNVFRNNDGADFDAMRALCGELGIRMVKAIGYIDPYDTTLRLCETGAVDDPASPQPRRLAWSLREALVWARVDRERPCLCQRIFPVIHSDGSVGICHLYAQPRLHARYMAVDFEALQRLRLAADHCRVCQRYALHRLDVDVLQSRHAIHLIPPPETTHA